MRRIPFLLLVALLLAACGGDDLAPASAPALVPLSLRVPASVPAGEPLQIGIDAPLAPDTTAVTLMLSGSYGPRFYTAVLTNGTAELTIPGSALEQSGRVTVAADLDGATQQAAFTVEPDRPVEPVTPLVGARSIIADGDHWAMVVAVPFDRFGNPVADATPVDVRIEHPGGWLEEEVVPTEHLLAWKRIWSGTKAGRTAVTVATLGQSGPEADLLEIAGWPVPFNVLAEDAATAVADGRQLIELRTETIVDAYDNPMPDGTQITFIVEDSDGTIRHIEAYTLDGIAKTILEAPAVAGDVRVYGVAYGVQGEPLVIPFGSGIAATADLPLTIRVDEPAGVVAVEVGPLLGALAQYVPEGTEVTFTIERSGLSDTLVGVTEGGYTAVAWRLAALEPGVYRLTVTAGERGVASEFEVPGRE